MTQGEIDRCWKLLEKRQTELEKAGMQRGWGLGKGGAEEASGNRKAEEHDFAAQIFDKEVALLREVKAALERLEAELTTEGERLKRGG